MAEKCYVICDGDRNVITFKGVQIFGKEVTVPGIFQEESDALEVLYMLEKTGLRGDNHIEVISTYLTGADEERS